MDRHGVQYWSPIDMAFVFAAAVDIEDFLKLTAVRKVWMENFS